jgi:hypothetical protein
VSGRLSFPLKAMSERFPTLVRSPQLLDYGQAEADGLAELRSGASLVTERAGFATADRPLRHHVPAILGGVVQVPLTPSVPDGPVEELT